MTWLRAIGRWLKANAGNIVAVIAAIVVVIGAGSAVYGVFWVIPSRFNEVHGNFIAMKSDIKSQAGRIQLQTERIQLQTERIQLQTERIDNLTNTVDGLATLPTDLANVKTAILGEINDTHLSIEKQIGDIRERLARVEHVSGIAARVQGRETQQRIVLLEFERRIITEVPLSISEQLTVGTIAEIKPQSNSLSVVNITEKTVSFRLTRQTTIKRMPRQPTGELENISLKDLQPNDVIAVIFEIEEGVHKIARLIVKSTEGLIQEGRIDPSGNVEDEPENLSPAIDFPYVVGQDPTGTKGTVETSGKLPPEKEISEEIKKGWLKRFFPREAADMAPEGQEKQEGSKLPTGEKSQTQKAPSE